MHYCSFARTHIGPGPLRHDGKQWKLLTESGAHWRFRCYIKNVSLGTKKNECCKNFKPYISILKKIELRYLYIDYKINL